MDTDSSPPSPGLLPGSGEAGSGRQRYIDEFVGRHNIPDLDTLEQMEMLAFRMLGNRLKYRIW